jgi:hypothetical protein
MADVSVPCCYCGNPAIPRRRYKNATEYACTGCGQELPLGATMFTLKDNDPDYYAFFPLDIERSFRKDIPSRPLWPQSVADELFGPSYDTLMGRNYVGPSRKVKNPIKVLER